MAESVALSKLTSRLNPENRAWVEALPPERQSELLKAWQSKGGATGLGSVGTDQEDVDVDALVEKWRK